MRCGKAKKLISVSLDGELDDPRDRGLKKHLAGCPKCRAFAGDLVRFSKNLDLLTAREPRWGFADRLMNRIATPQPDSVSSGSWLDFLRPVPLGLGATAFCLGVIVTVLIGAGQITDDTRLENGIAVAVGDYLDTLSEDAVEEKLLALLPDVEK